MLEQGKRIREVLGLFRRSPSESSAQLRPSASFDDNINIAATAADTGILAPSQLRDLLQEIEALEEEVAAFP